VGLVSERDIVHAIGNHGASALDDNVSHHMWTAPACKSFESASAHWSGAVICPALRCGAYDRWP
jgi:hypothetical protein